MDSRRNEERMKRVTATDMAMSHPFLHSIHEEILRRTPNLMMQRVPKRVAKLRREKFVRRVETEFQLTRIPPRFAPIAQLVEQMTLNH